MTDLVAAIDGGGTLTKGLMAEPSGRLHPLRPGPPCNPQDGPDWRAGLAAVLDQIPPGTPVAIGMAGFGEVPADDAEARAFLDGRPGTRCVALVNDVALALEGAFGGGEGVLLLSGTGSMAMARGPSGVARSGGWGAAFGDEGSAWWIGRAALARAAAERDGRAPGSGFAAALSARIGAPERPFGLIEWALVEGAARPRIAAVARAVDALAPDWPEARAILTAAADELVATARAAAARAGLDAGFGWCAAGSTFRSGPLMQACAAALGPARPAMLDALRGGLVLAAREAGAAFGPDFAGRIAQASTEE